MWGVWVWGSTLSSKFNLLLDHFVHLLENANLLYIMDKFVCFQDIVPAISKYNAYENDDCMLPILHIVTPNNNNQLIKITINSYQVDNHLQVFCNHYM